MSAAFEPVVTLWSKLRAGHRPLPTVAAIAPTHCRPSHSAGCPIARDEMYFTVRISEMHLAENREWWTDYDPLVVVVTEFNYGQERIAAPAVIGPNLIRRQNQSDRPRHGVVLLDQRVTGPHPYRGGDVDVSLSLYQVQRANHARTLLNVVDSLSASLAGPGEVQAIAKAGGALLEGIEGLLGLQETVYLAGHRISLATSPFDPFVAGFSALIVPPSPADPAHLVVQDRRLLVETHEGSRPYRESDFVLLSITGAEARGDESQLPFYPLKVEALSALWEGEDGVKRCKANLVAAYQQMRRSPDVTAAEAGRLFDAWLEEFENEKKRVVQMNSMPLQRHEPKVDPLARDLDDALKRLAL
jgi:hypothetical protein